jgi:pimeloyl-ACP methyl ester carboxylesterase
VDQEKYMPYLKIEKDVMFFEIYGSELDLSDPMIAKKPTIIVLHGGTGQLDHTYEISFWQQAAAFAQVIFIDHRGLGRSSLSADMPWSLEQWAQDVYYFCQTLGIHAPFIAGDSLGGHVAMQFGILYPQFAAGIILLDTEAQCDRNEIINAFRERSEAAAKIAETCLYAPTPESVAEYMRVCLPLCTAQPIPAETYRHCTIVNEDCLTYYNQNVLYHFNLHDKLHLIQSSVLYLASRSNPFHNLASAIKTSQNFAPGIVDFQIVENCGLVQNDAPDFGMAAVKEFIHKAKR